MRMLQLERWVIVVATCGLVGCGDDDRRVPGTGDAGGSGPRDASAAGRDGGAASTDDAGSVASIDAARPRADSGPIESADFDVRCRAPGVVRCFGFDVAADLAGGYGDNHGSFTGDIAPELDTENRASGASSMKFTIPSMSGSGASGSWFTNFSDDLSVQFDGSEEFYVQWRQRFSRDFIETYYTGGGGWKHVIIGTGDQPGMLYASCTALEVVVQNTQQRRFAQMYNSCEGSDSHGPYDPFNEAVPPYDFRLQGARAAPGCLYSQGQTDPPTFFPPTGNCFGYAPDEWMTFQVGITLGPRVGNEFVGSQIRLWIAREGQPSEPVLDWGPYNLTAGAPSENQRFGKVWLLPYHTNKDPSQAHAVAYTWYDELIVSRTRIADPS